MGEDAADAQLRNTVQAFFLAMDALALRARGQETEPSDGALCAPPKWLAGREYTLDSVGTLMRNGKPDTSDPLVIAVANMIKLAFLATGASETQHVNTAAPVYAITLDQMLGARNDLDQRQNKWLSAVTHIDPAFDLTKCDVSAPYPV